jgi:hypothetical protein
MVCKGPPLKLPRQGVQKLHDQVDLCASERPSQLHAGHGLHGILERAGPSVVKIGRGQYNVPQAWHTEHPAVSGEPRHAKASRVIRGAGADRANPIWENAELLKQVSTEIQPLMACDTALGFKELVATLFLGAQRLLLTSKVLIEPGIRGNEGPLIGGQGV